MVMTVEEEEEEGVGRGRGVGISGGGDTPHARREPRKLKRQYRRFDDSGSDTGATNTKRVERRRAPRRQR